MPLIFVFNTIQLQMVDKYGKQNERYLENIEKVQKS